VKIIKTSLFILITVLLFLNPLSGKGEALFPPITRTTLKNGLTLLIVERQKLPLVMVSVLIKAGSIYEREEKAGLANLTAELLTKGTKRRSAKEIAEEIDFVGGSLWSNCGYDAAYAGVNVLKKDLTLGLDLLSDILLHPAFSDSEIGRKRGEIIAEIIRQKDEPEIVLQKTFQDLVYEKHPYHRPLTGYEETLPKITQEDILSFYQNFYCSNNSILAVVGDVNTKQVIHLIDKYFGKWKKKTISLPLIPEPLPVKKSRVKMVKKELNQGYINWGHVGMSRKNPDYEPARLMNYILGGGGFSSRLVENIRQQQGLAYDVHSYFDPRFYPGPFVAGLQTKTESVDQAVKSLLTEIRRIRTELVTDQELKDAKTSYTGHFPLKFETNNDLAKILLDIEFYGLGLDYFTQFNKRIESVTKEDILKVAQKYLDPDHFVLVVVGDTEKINLSLPEVERIE